VSSLAGHRPARHRTISSSNESGTLVSCNSSPFLRAPEMQSSDELDATEVGMLCRAAIQDYLADLHLVCGPHMRAAFTREPTILRREGKLHECGLDCLPTMSIST